MNVETEFKIRVETADERQVVFVQGALGLANVAKLHWVLIDAWQERRPLILNLAGVTEIDLSGMQLLSCTRDSFAERSLSFGLQEVPDGLSQKAAAAGLKRIVQ